MIVIMCIYYHLGFTVLHNREAGMILRQYMTRHCDHYHQTAKSLSTVIEGESML